MVRFQSMSRCRGRLIRAARFSAPVDRGPGPLGDPPLQVVDDLARPPAGRSAWSWLGHHPVQREQRADQVHVGLDRLQHLRLQQQPGQVEPLDRVGLHHLDDGGREVLPDVAEPAGHVGAPTRRARPARAAGPRPAGRRVVERGQRGVDPGVVAGQRARRCRRLVAAEHQPPAAQPLVGSSPALVLRTPASRIAAAEQGGERGQDAAAPLVVESVRHAGAPARGRPGAHPLADGAPLRAGEARRTCGAAAAAPR